MAYHAGRPVDLDDHPPKFVPHVKEEPFRVGSSYVRPQPPAGVAVYSHQMPNDPESLEELAQFEAGYNPSVPDITVAGGSAAAAPRPAQTPGAGVEVAETWGPISLTEALRDPMFASPGGPSSIASGALASGETSSSSEAITASSSTHRSTSPEEAAEAMTTTTAGGSWKERPPHRLLRRPPVAYFLPRTNGQTHERAVCAGRDVDGAKLFVGRAYVCGELLPGKITATHSCCYVPLEGREISCRAYEILVLENARPLWVKCRDGKHPANAFPTGRTLRGEKIYTARASCSGIVTPGMLFPNKRHCSIPFNTTEYKFGEYEVLTIGPQEKESLKKKDTKHEEKRKIFHRIWPRRRTHCM